MNPEKILFQLFIKYPELIAGVSRKQDGNMKLSDDAQKNEKIRTNRQAFFRKLGINEDDLVSGPTHSIHGARAAAVNFNQKRHTIEDADALIGWERNLFLSITAADCLPIFLFNPRANIVALIHAGWKGLAKGIIKNTFLAVQKIPGVEATEFLVGIGPGICKDHFEVKEDVLAQFSSYKECFYKKGAAQSLDLKSIAQNQLLSCGVSAKNVEISSKCTYCLGDEYFSWRRDHPPLPETMIAVIGVR